MTDDPQTLRPLLSELLARRGDAGWLRSAEAGFRGARKPASALIAPAIAFGVYGLGGLAAVGFYRAEIAQALGFETAPPTVAPASPAAPLPRRPPPSR